MFYLAWQTLLWLIVAFLFGLFIGRLIWHRRIDAAEEEQQTQIRDLSKKLNACNDRLKRYEQDLVRSRTKKPETKTTSPVTHADSKKPDNLQEIRGIGPFLERKCHAFGIYTFKQIARFKPDDIKKLAATFGSFEGRIIRDRWVEQSKELHLKKYGEKL